MRTKLSFQLTLFLMIFLGGLMQEGKAASDALPPNEVVSLYFAIKVHLSSLGSRAQPVTYYEDGSLDVSGNCNALDLETRLWESIREACPPLVGWKDMQFDLYFEDERIVPAELLSLKTGNTPVVVVVDVHADRLLSRESRTFRRLSAARSRDQNFAQFDSKAPPKDSLQWYIGTFQEIESGKQTFPIDPRTRPTVIPATPESPSTDPLPNPWATVGNDGLPRYRLLRQ